MDKLLKTAEREVLWALLGSSVVSIGFVIVRVMNYDSPRYIFLIWNLFLAWIPLLAAWWLTKRLQSSRWVEASNLVLTAVWLLFLPNSFYIVSDFTHLFLFTVANELYDAVMMTSFAFNGLVLGFISLYLVHRQLMKRLSQNRVRGLILLILLACSYAIYLGRYLRWNSWDLLFQPAGLLFDVSEQIINPNVQSLNTTLIFFVLLSSMYTVVWRLVAATRRSE